MKALLAAGALLSLACAPPAPLTLDWTEAERAAIASLSPLPPVPPDPTNAIASSPAAIELGRRLFFDPRLSPDGRFSCATCHSPALGFADASALPAGRAALTRHAPSLWNAAHHRWYFWDGRADTLWGQAAGPIENPAEMDGDRLSVVRLVGNDAALRALFTEAVGEPPPSLASVRPLRARPGEDGAQAVAAWATLTSGERESIDAAFAVVLKSLAAFEATLVSGEAPFDRFARGLASGEREDLAALSLEAQRGLRVFLGPGRCTLCHFGPLFSDREFHDTRVPPRDGPPARDPARYEGIARLRSETSFTSFGPRSDAPDGEQARLSRALVREGRTWGEFKTPSLREAALSPPYMHQGQFATLADVVRYYSTLEGALPLGHHQETPLVAAQLDDREQADLVAFLEALTSEHP